LLPRTVLAAACLLLSGGCASRETRPTRPTSAVAEVARRARALIARGSYASLLEAHAIRRDLHEQEPGSLERRRDRIRSALLVALRERQLAILGDAHLDEAEELMPGCAECPLEAAMAAAVRGALTRGAGVVRDSRPRGGSHPERREVLEWFRLLSEQALSDASAAVFLVDLWQSHGRVFGVPDRTEDLVAAHPDSPLVLVSAALVGWGEHAERALALEPSMAEAHLLLGRAARARDMGAALDHLRVAARELPRSVAAGLAFADLLFSLEDYAAALEGYEALLELAPEHREAHLRRGQVLQVVGRPREAVAVLARLFELGNWYLGEAHYWTGLALRDVGEGKSAGRHAALGQRWLPDDPRLRALAGSLALEQGDEEAARAAFAEAVAAAERSSTDWAGDESLCEAHYFLGVIASHSEDWEQGARHNRAAAACYRATEEAAAAGLATVRSWTLDAERRGALIASRRRRLDRAAQQRAGSLYNAAVCHYRAGEAEAARALASEAAAHEAYAERVEQLLSALR
jgi:tetratricopeptide (TPR) repeat protein